MPNGEVKYIYLYKTCALCVVKRDIFYLFCTKQLFLQNIKHTMYCNANEACLYRLNFHSFFLPRGLDTRLVCRKKSWCLLDIKTLCLCLSTRSRVVDATLPHNDTVPFYSPLYLSDHLPQAVVGFNKLISPSAQYSYVGKLGCLSYKASILLKLSSTYQMAP